MIIREINKLKKYLPAVALNCDFSQFEDALQVSEDSITTRILGEEIRLLIDGSLSSETSEHKPLTVLVERVICNQAFLASIPELDLILTEQGFAVSDGAGYTPASRQRVDKLSGNISSKLNEALDALVLYLVKSKKYASWRETEQFNYLSMALVYTFSEYCRHSPVSDKSPKNFSEFYNLIPSLYTALYQVVAPYLSSAYMDELVEKVRDNKIILPVELSVLSLVRDSVCLHVAGSVDIAHEKILAALRIMKKDIELFTTFASSPEAQSLDIAREDSPVYSML